MASISQGRFLSKKTQEKLGSIVIEAYRFDQLGDQMLIPDNPRKSLLLKSMHTEQELAEKVRPATQFQKNLVPRSKILFPEDLTNDYIRTQEELRVKNRRKLMDEEEAVAQELADMMERNKSGAEQMSWKGGKKNQSQSGEGSSPLQSGIVSDTAAAEMENASNARVDSLHAAAEMAVAAGVRDQPVFPIAGVNSSCDSLQTSGQHATNSGLNSVDVEGLREQISHESWQAGFNEGRAAGVSAGHDEGLAQGVEQGHKQGFVNGFESGETRGEAAGETKVDRMLTLLGEVMHQIDLVRSEILASGQEIFVEFAKLATETILRTQIAVKDETLKSFLVHTMTPFAEKSFLTLEMSPSEAKRVAQVLVEYPDLQKKVKVKENSQLAAGDFRVEADNEVVVVDLKKVVGAFVESLKNDILTPQLTKESA